MEKIEKYLKNVNNITGIIQVGANTGQELPVFKKYTNNIILIEPLQQLCNVLTAICPECMVVPYAVGLEDTNLDYYLSSNNGESSSLLKPKNHTIVYPGITFRNMGKVPVRKVDTLIEQYGDKFNTCNVLMSDTQGYDLEVVKSFGTKITQFELIYLEFINNGLYEDETNNIPSISEYLNQFNYTLFEIDGDVNGSGNVVYYKSKN